MRTAGVIAFAALLAVPAWAQPVPPPQLDLPRLAPPSSTASGEPLCAPEKLTRMVVRNISPGLPAAAPAAQPRTLYRQGALYMRSEESPDPARGQPVVIVAEPDVWMLNLSTRTGQHQVDPGPEFVVRAPVLPMTAETPPQFRSLEYGCELDFLRRNGAESPLQVVPWGESKATVHQVTVGEHQLSVLLTERRQLPLLVAYSRAGKGLFMMRYDEFRNDLADRPALFAPPKNMRITEAGPLNRPAAPTAPPPKP